MSSWQALTKFITSRPVLKIYGSWIDWSQPVTPLDECMLSAACKGKRAGAQHISLNAATEGDVAQTCLLPAWGSSGTSITDLGGEPSW